MRLHTTVHHNQWLRLGFLAAAVMLLFSTVLAGQTVVPATLLTPVPGVAAAEPVVFSWNAVPSALSYYLYIGTTLGGKDLYDSGELQGTSLAVNLPAGQFCARLFTLVGGNWEHTDSFFLSSGAAGADLAYLQSPITGTQNVNVPAKFTWSTVENAEAYYLYVGTSYGLSDIYNSGEIQATSLTVKLAPGRKYYATLWTEVNGQWAGADSWFTTATQMIAPADGSAGFPVNSPFVWNSVQGALSYSLSVGTAPGQNDIYTSGILATSDVVVPALTPGTRYYVTVATHTPAGVSYVNTSFTAGEPATTAASMLYPQNGASSVVPLTPFCWTNIADAQAYYLYIGSAPGLNDIYNHGESQSNCADVHASLRTGLYYIRIYTEEDGAWKYVDSTFISGDRSSMIFPADGATDVDDGSVFSWTALPGATCYFLYVGTYRGGKDIYQSGETQDTSRTISPLEPGQTYYVRLYTYTGGAWLYADSTFTAGTGIAQLLQPQSTSTAFYSDTPFSWTTVPDAQAYYLRVGSTPGSGDAFDSGELKSDAVFVSNLKAGATYYARLYTEKNGSWRYTDSSFQAPTTSSPGPSTSAPAAILSSPTDGSTGVNPLASISWTAPDSSSYEYFLQVGTAPGSGDVFSSAEIAANAVLPVGLGYAQRYNVRLWTGLNGSWNYSDAVIKTAAAPTGSALSQAQSSFYSTVWQLTSNVRMMADSATNIPIPGTPLAAYVSSYDGTYATCAQFAIILTQQLWANQIGSRQRDLGLTPIDTHVIVEYYDPFLNRWEATDPTFGLTYFDSTRGVGQSVDELNALVTNGDFNEIHPRTVTPLGTFFATTYYLDPTVLFENVSPPGVVLTSFGSPAPFLRQVDLPDALGSAGEYVVEFANSSDNIAVSSGGITTTVAPIFQGGWSNVFQVGSGWTISAMPAGASLYSVQRILF